MNCYVVIHRLVGDASDAVAVYRKRDDARACADALNQGREPGALEEWAVEEVPLNPAKPPEPSYRLPGHLGR